MQPTQQRGVGSHAFVPIHDAHSTRATVVPTRRFDFAKRPGSVASNTSN